VAKKQPSKNQPAPYPTGQRAVQVAPYLNRWVPYWGHPGWLMGDRWRALVRNQGVALVCRETLIMNVLSMDWDITAADPDNADKPEVKAEITYYKNLFKQLEGDFDTYTELMLQDALDLPFGAACEVGREDDAPDGRVLWAEHIDGATLLPTNDPEYPVKQTVKDVPGRIVTFPAHAIERIYMTPRPEILRKGWGMAPPEKVYLAMEMLFRGDKYYANLLLDTPEAGILDLMDFSEEDVDEWREGLKTTFQGIDGFKVPILYAHEQPAQWIPFNRPPIDMLYDKVTYKYAQIVAAAYGLRLSDIGMSELGGEKTLAGVIRGERQTRRSGFAWARTKLENHYNRLLPKEPYELQFVWIDDNDEALQAKGRALVSVGQGITQLVTATLITRDEARMELKAYGLFKTDLPDKAPTPENPAQPFPFSFRKPGEDKGGQEKVPPSEGGRGEETLSTRAAPPFAGRATEDELRERLRELVEPGLALIAERCDKTRMRRLIKATVRAMLPQVKRTFDVLSDDQIDLAWLPEMDLLEFGFPSEMDSAVVRQESDEIREVLESHLEDDPWWKVMSEIEKARTLRVFIEAYEVGLADTALEIVRTLYEEGLLATPNLMGLDFKLVNKRTMKEIEALTADMVTHVDTGTKFFIKRIVSAGVRRGLSSPKIATAIREGAAAEAILGDDEFLANAERIIRDGLIEMSKARANSIVNTEINRAESAGRLKQIAESGLETKGWVHRGARGVTEAGNVHPCPVCAGNEALGFVPLNHVYRTVFGDKLGEGGSLTPPGHPNVCHCGIAMDEKEILDKLGSGEYKPWIGK